MKIVSEVAAAEARIRAHVRETPVEESPVLGRGGDRHVHLKLENYQVTGSFKVRGVVNKLLTLEPDARRRGVIAASSGNHGAALSYAQAAVGCRATVVVPENVSATKLEAIRAGGAEVVVHGEDSVDCEIWARAEAERRGIPYVSPYNDLAVVAGQGTIGVELDRQLERLDAIYVAVGGGGLISGVAAYLKARRPGLEVVGCSPRRSSVMHDSLAAGRVVSRSSRPTLSDGTAGGIERDAVTFELCRGLVDRFVLVDEEAIAAAMRLVIEKHHMMVEGAAAVPVAALLRDGERNEGQHVVLILCGANVSVDVLRRVLA